MGDMIITNLTTHDMLMLGTVLGCSLFLIDDLFVDFLALFKRLKAEKYNKEDVNNMLALPEKKFAVLIANWHEAEIIERVVAGNINNIKYKNYEVILGVYPNDTETLEAARRVEKRFKNVTVVVNTKNGPTSKGQMLNQMVNFIESHNKNGDAAPFEAVAIHDSEDVIHEYSLKLMNQRTQIYDFVQIPVFSLDIPFYKLTAGIYIDEFVESHTKDLLVRDHYNAGLPSAGVGTAVTWSAVQKLMKLQNGQFLDENTLTEDYHLGLTCHDLKLPSNFACVYFDKEQKDSDKTKTEYVATREFFPQKIRQSVRQKTRWALGVSLQGFEHRMWKSSQFMERYFLWRDRKGLVNAPLFTAALMFTVYFVTTWFQTGEWPALDFEPMNPIFTMMMWGNLLFSIFRIINRMSLVSSVYGLKMAALVPIRWFLSNFINTSSTYGAIYQWSSAKVRGELPIWAKTDHVIPVGFGLENLDIIEAKAPEAVTETETTTTNNTTTQA